MSTKVTVETPKRQVGISCSVMPSCTIGIITAINAAGAHRTSKIGDPVIRCAKELFFPKVGLWTVADQADDIFYRELCPGERIVIEG